MYALNVWLTVQDPANTAAVRNLLQEHAGLSQKEPGCLRFEVYQSDVDPNRFLLVEQWTDKAAWEVHRQATAVQTIYAPQVLPLVHRDSHPSQQIA
jgi:quinol monooxygenase YgiN